MDTGLIKHMPELEYRAHAAVAHSDLKNMKRSPAYCHHVKTHGSTSSPAMALGTAIHAAALEPAKYAATYVRDFEDPDRGGFPPGWRNKKVYKEWRAQQGLMNKTPLAPEHFDAMPQILTNLQNDPIGSMIFEVADGTEYSCFAEDPEFGVVRKCRPDLLASRAHMVVDLKTGDVAHTIEAFERQCLNLGYYTAAPYYLDTLELTGEIYEHYTFVHVATSAPYEVNSFTLDEDTMEQGRLDYRRLLRRYAQCVKDGRWPSGTGKVREARIPGWAINYHETDEEDEV